MIDTDQLQDDESALYSCRRCQRKLRALDGDGEHMGGCYAEVEVDKARQREAMRRLHRDTARLLKRMGFSEEAAWHDVEAGR